MERYEGKKVVIIGGTSGMGLATAKMLSMGCACSGDGAVAGRPGFCAERAPEGRRCGFERRRVR